MSEAELHILKSRLHGGILNKARRGELEMPLPVGLVYDGAGRVVLDPDRQVRDSVAMVFEVFRDLGSASAVVRRLRAQEVMFPRRIRRGIGKGDLLWGALDVSRALQILHNPRYAGAFAYGRTRMAFNAQLRPVQRQVKQPDWPVLIRDVHEGYIDWPEFERNQHKLRQNLGFSPGERGSMPREGSALLQGRLLCGKCGSRMRVHYEKLSGQLRPYYRCTQEVVRRAGKPCQWVHGLAVDEAIGALLMQTVAPAAIEVALAVQEEIAQRIEQAAARRQAQLERASYEAELARRRYAKVDPDNRLVADALEADWNQRLRELDNLQREHERQHRDEQARLDAPARQRITDLARDFARVWNDSRTSALERKRMLALLIEDVTLVAGPSIAVHVRWRGGRTQSLCVDKPRPIAQIRKTAPDVVKLIDELLETSTDTQVAARLNELGYRNWRGESFSPKKVIVVRNAYKLRSRFERLRQRGMLTGEEMAQRLAVSSTTIHQLGRQGVLVRHLYGNNHRCLYEPPNGGQLIRGAGGRYGGRPARYIPAQPTEQGAI